MIAHASELVKSSQGRRALLYPLTGRARRHLTPAQIATLAETDIARSTTSKKDAAVRAEEIRKAASEGMLEWVVKDGASVVRDPGGSLVVTDVMLHADGDKEAAMRAIITPASAPYPSEDASLPHPIDLAHTARVYKTLLQGGHFSQIKRTVEVSPHFSAPVFATQWVALVGKDVTLASATGEGAFVAAALCESLAGNASAPERAAVTEWFTDGGQEQVRQWDGRGKAVLEQAIDRLISS
jgi:pumilio homology domain family member 6